jgi:hypothetical protein
MRAIRVRSQRRSVLSSPPTPRSRCPPFIAPTQQFVGDQPVQHLLKAGQAKCMRCSVRGGVHPYQPPTPPVQTPSLAFRPRGEQRYGAELRIGTQQWRDQEAGVGQRRAMPAATKASASS